MKYTKANAADTSLKWYRHITPMTITCDTMSERMDRKREERKNRILDVAEQMIAAKGIDGMTMEDVAREADVAAGTTYLHFKNKNSLCASVLARLLREATATEAKAATSCNTGSEKLLAYRKALAEFLLQNPGKREVMRQLRRIDFSAVDDPEVIELVKEYNRVVQIVAGFYCEGIEEGAIRPDLDPVPTAIFLQLALTTASDITPLLKTVLELNDIEPRRWARVTDDLITMATHTVRPTDQSARETEPAKKK